MITTPLLGISTQNPLEALLSPRLSYQRGRVDEERCVDLALQWLRCVWVGSWVGEAWRQGEARAVNGGGRGVLLVMLVEVGPWQ